MPYKDAGKRRETRRKYREANREKILEEKRRHREANRDKLAEYHRQYRERNLEKIRQQQRKSYEDAKIMAEVAGLPVVSLVADPERRRETRNQFYAANREKVLGWQRKRREAKKAQRQQSPTA